MPSQKESGKGHNFVHDFPSEFLPIGYRPNRQNDEEKLIASVRVKTFIFNKSDKRHADRDIMQAAWNSVAKEVGGNGEYLQKYYW